MVTSCPARTVQVMRSGDDEAQMTDDSSSGVAPIGDGGAPNTDADLIMGVSIFGASRLALSSRLWSPGSTAKSAQTLLVSLSSSRTIMIVSPGPVLHALRTIPTCSLGSNAPSYIWTGRSLRAQPAQKNPTTVSDTQQCSHADALAFRMGLPLRSLDEETVCVSIAVSRRGGDEEYSFFTAKSSQPFGEVLRAGRREALEVRG